MVCIFQSTRDSRYDAEKPAAPPGVGPLANLNLTGLSSGVLASAPAAATATRLRLLELFRLAGGELDAVFAPEDGLALLSAPEDPPPRRWALLPLPPPAAAGGGPPPFARLRMTMCGSCKCAGRQGKGK